MDSGTSVSPCSFGSAGPMGCSVLMLCLHPVLDVPPALGLHCPSLPGQLCCFALLWACPQILLELGLLEQTSHSCCLWQLSAQLYSPILCSACSLQALGPGFGVWFVSVWCSGAGSGSGEAVVGFGDHLGKVPGMSKGIIWTRARER